LTAIGCSRFVAENSSMDRKYRKAEKKTEGKKVLKISKL
jgi:hypothetical protein